MSTPSTHDRAGERIVEAQDQREDRALAGARRADDGDRLAGLHREGQARAAPACPAGPDRRRRRCRSSTRACRRGRQRRSGLAGAAIAGCLGQDFGQPLGGARGLARVRPRLPTARRARRRRTPNRSGTGRACRATSCRSARRANRTTAPSTTEAKIVKMAKKVRTARALTDERAASKAASTARENLPVTSFSLVKACSVRTDADLLAGIGGRLRPACPAPCRDLRRTERPKATSGNTTSGIAAITRLDSFGLVTTIMPTAPRPRMVLRSATDAVAPTADLTCVVSAVSRETISPDCDRVEEGRRQSRHMGEDVACADRRRPARRA